MAYQRRARSAGCYVVLALLMVPLGQAAALGEMRVAAPTAGVTVQSLSAAGARLAWQADVPVNFVDRVRNYWLVDEYLYALTTDGKVRAFRADTGELLWVRPMTEPLENLWPPVAYDTREAQGVAFTLPDQVLFLDPATGLPLQTTVKDAEGETVTRQIGPIHLSSGTIASVAVSADAVYQPAPRKRIREYSIPKDLPGWQVAAEAEIQLSPLYVANRGLLAFADTGGTVIGVLGQREVTLTITGERTERTITKFATHLTGRPVGWLAADDTALYVVTNEPRLHALDLDDGHERLEGYPEGYLLPGQPAGGPIVTGDSVYQATDAGLQRLGKELRWPNWLARDAKAFLAEWTGQVALLRKDGKIVFVRMETGEPQAMIDPGPGFQAISNPRNDEIIVGTARGDIRCYRPLGAPPLLVADFRPPASQPASQPAAVAAVTTAPATETAEKPEETGAETPAEEPAAAVPSPPQKAGPQLSPLEALIADPLKSRR